GMRRMQQVLCVCAGLLALTETRAIAAQPNPFEQRVAQAVRLQLRQDSWTAGQMGSHGPLKILLREPGNGATGQPERQSLSFDLEVSFSKLLPALRAEQLIFYRDGHVDLGKDGKLVYRHPDKTPF